MFNFIELIEDFTILGKRSIILPNPDGSGLIIDGKVFIAWDEIKELREDYWLNRLKRMNLLYKKSAIVTNVGTFRSYPLSDNIKNLIINNAGLKNTRYSFFRSQKIFSI